VPAPQPVDDGAGRNRRLDDFFGKLQAALPWVNSFGVSLFKIAGKARGASSPNA